MMVASDSSVAPSLSVVVASAKDTAALERCLHALMPQVVSPETEIWVVGVADQAQQQQYPDVHFITYPEGTPAPLLWGKGIERAKGDLIAITETQTVVDEAWAQAALRVQALPYPIMGGAVEPLPKANLTSWAAYFCDYGAFMQPWHGEAVPALPGNNVVFKRTLLQHGREYTQPEFWKTYWCRSLMEAGVALVANQELVAFDAKTYRFLAFMKRRYRHGRCFGGMRNWQLNSFQRLIYALASPALPALFLFRLGKDLLPKRRYRRKLLLSLPIIVLAVTGWAIGEGIGYLAGPGGTCQYV